MKIRHFLTNAFIIEDDNTKIAIDPGKNLGLFDKKKPDSCAQHLTFFVAKERQPCLRCQIQAGN
jgi:L-ascorbate metabolism protein UlaG (beta-lactamase superfamily)